MGTMVSAQPRSSRYAYLSTRTEAVDVAAYQLARFIGEPLWLSLKGLADNLVCCDQTYHEALSPACRFRNLHRKVEYQSIVRVQSDCTLISLTTCLVSGGNNGWSLLFV